MFASTGACCGREAGSGWEMGAGSSSAVEDDGWGEVDLRNGAMVGASADLLLGTLGRPRFGSSSRCTAALLPGPIVAVYEALESSSIFFSSLWTCCVSSTNDLSIHEFVAVC